MGLFKGLIKEGNIVMAPDAASTPLANKAFSEAKTKLNEEITSLKDFFAFMQNNEAFFGEKVVSSIKARIEEARKLGNLRQYRVVNPETLDIEGFGYKNIMDRIIDDQPFVASAKINYLLANLDRVIELLSLEGVTFDSFNQVNPKGNCLYNLNRYIMNLAKHADKLQLVEGNLGELSNTKDFFIGPLDEAIQRYPAIGAAEIESFVAREKDINAQVSETLSTLAVIGQDWNDNLDGLTETYNILNELNQKSFKLLTEKEDYEKLEAKFNEEIKSREEDEALQNLENSSWLTQEEFKEKKLASMLQKHQTKYLALLHELASKQNLLKKVGDDYELYNGINSLTPYALMIKFKKGFGFVLHTNNTVFDTNEEDYSKLSENLLFLTEEQNTILEYEYYRLSEAMQKRNFKEESFPNFSKDFKNNRTFENSSFETKKEIFNFINENRASLYKMLTEKEQNNYDSFYTDTLLTKHIMENIDTVHTMLQLQGFRNTKDTLQIIMQENTESKLELNEQIDKNYAIYNKTVETMKSLQKQYTDLERRIQKYKAAYYQPYEDLAFATFDSFNSEMAVASFPMRKEELDKSGYFDSELSIPVIDIETFQDKQCKYGAECTDEISKIEECMNSEEKDDAKKVMDSLDLITKDDRGQSNIRMSIVNHTIAFTEFVSILNTELFTINEEENK